MNTKLKLTTLMLATGVMATGLISGPAFAQDSSTHSVEEKAKSEMSDTAKDAIEDNDTADMLDGEDLLVSDPEKFGLGDDALDLESPSSEITYPDEDGSSLEDETISEPGSELETATECPDGTTAQSNGTCKIDGASKDE